jgi:prepilin-type N-terminal cleavage/methylation domain-containing protein
MRPPRRRADPRRRKGGYTLLEMLIVLGIMALAIAIVLPRGEAALDQMTAHAVFFDFQRQVSDLRREAYASETPTAVRAPDDTAPADAAGRLLRLRSGWSYRLDQPIEITAGGLCTPARVEVTKLGAPVMHLVSSDSACHFTRLD